MKADKRVSSHSRWWGPVFKPDKKGRPSSYFLGDEILSPQIHLDHCSGEKLLTPFDSFQGRPMPSPFPGMDPYLEAHWRDVHASLIIYARDALQGVLPAALRARVEERVLLETPQGLADHPLFPDVRVVEFTSKRDGPETRPAGRAALAEPLLIDAAPESSTETFLEIIDRESGNRVVTVMEFLSPSNKSPGPNREQYLRKQREVCASDANLVEIDLNRFGGHTLAFPLEHVKPQGRTAYMVCVRRAVRPGMAEVYPMPLWERLPILKGPLRPNGTDVPADFQ